MGNLLTALKEIFSGSSQTNPTNIPTCASDGTPNGNVDITHLASVLGGIGNLNGKSGILKIPTESPYCYNPNELFGTFSYRYIQNTQGTSQNLPPDIGNNNGYCLTIPGPYEQQLFYCYARGAYFTRMKTGNTITDWCRLDNFGCNTPSELASLLGVYGHIGTFTISQGGVVTIGGKEGGGCCIVGLVDSSTGNVFFGYANWQGNFMKIIDAKNNVSYGEDSEGSIRLYYDTTEYKLHIKSMINRDLTFNYFILD